MLTAGWPTKVTSYLHHSISLKKKKTCGKWNGGKKHCY